MTLPRHTRTGRCAWHRWLPPETHGIEGVDRCHDCGKTRPAKTSRGGSLTAPARPAGQGQTGKSGEPRETASNGSSGYVTRPSRGGTPRRSQPRRYWADARAKVEAEGVCRLAHADDPCEGPLEAAHVIGRERDFYSLADIGDDMFPGGCRVAMTVLHVEPVRVFPLCRRHHRLFDAGERDCLHVLSIAEQLQAVADAGGAENMRVRTCPSLYRSTKEAA